MQPLVALSVGIASAGHEVTVVGTDDFEPLVRRHGLGFRGMGFTSLDQITSPSGRAWIGTSAGNPWRELRLLLDVGREWTDRVAEGLLPLAGTADLFVSGILSLASVDALARHDGVPHRAAMLSPFHPSADGRVGLTAPFPRRISPPNRWAGWVTLGVSGRVFGLAGQEVRRRLGMPTHGLRDHARALLGTPTALGASRLLVPPPRDWDERAVRVTGSWSLPADPAWRPTAALAAFLDDGPPPVYVGFGSMAAAERGDVVALARTAARRTGVRVLLRTGDDGNDSLDDVLEIGDAPHEQLLPRTAAAIHHGGAGTTHAALRAGVPSAAVPHIGDQPYWGRRLAELGVGVAPLPRHRLDADSLGDLLIALLRAPGLAERADRAGRLLRAEDGVAIAVRALRLEDSEPPR